MNIFAIYDDRLVEHYTPAEHFRRAWAFLYWATAEGLLLISDEDGHLALLAKAQACQIQLPIDSPVGAGNVWRNPLGFTWNSRDLRIETPEDLQATIKAALTGR